MSQAFFAVLPSNLRTNMPEDLFWSSIIYCHPVCERGFINMLATYIIYMYCMENWFLRAR
jgi:hypothetical protein